MSQLDRFIKKTGESYQINNKSEYYQFGFKELDLFFMGSLSGSENNLMI